MRRVSVGILLIASALFLAFPGNGGAQTAPPKASSALETLQSAKQPLPRETVRDLVARLNDVEVRKLLLERLDAVDRAVHMIFDAAQVDVEIVGNTAVVIAV